MTFGMAYATLRLSPLVKAIRRKSLGMWIQIDKGLSKHGLSIKAYTEDDARPVLRELIAEDLNASNWEIMK